MINFEEAAMAWGVQLTRANELERENQQLRERIEQLEKQLISLRDDSKSNNSNPNPHVREPDNTHARRIVESRLKEI